jgi:hypothetical protein
MSGAVSREGFDELKNYLGVYMQQGRVLLDSDWNESQQITSSMLKLLSREALGEGSPNQGFKIDRIFPIPLDELAAQIEASMKQVDPTDPGQGLDEVIQNVLQEAVGNCVAFMFGFLGAYFFAPLMFFIQFPGAVLDEAESLEGWELDPQANLRLGRDVPYSGNAFFRVSGFAGTVQLVKTLPQGETLDISAYELMIFRFRMSRRVPGPIRFFMDDASGGRTTWTFQNPALASEQWLAGFATPLDVRFRITTPSPLPTAYQKKPDNSSFSYTTPVVAVGGVAPLTWSLSSGALPAGITIQTSSGSGSDPAQLQQMRIASLQGTPTANGTFQFELKATDANGVSVTKQFSLTVAQTSPSDFPGAPLPGPLDILEQTAIYEVGPGGPVDPSKVVRYGFELYQDTAPGAAPLAWDIDDLRLGSSALYESMGENDFIIRGSELSQLQAQLALMGLIRDNSGAASGGGSTPIGDVPGELDDVGASLLQVLNTDFQISQPSLEDAGRLHVDGYPAVLVDDTLYSDQADPADPPITTPATGTGTREDTVYLDVWEEPVTFVEDPDIREIALGGPDTSTRRRLRRCVRVAQGGPMPSGDGRGHGLLATEGAYTGRDNRLFRIEIEDAGELGAATFRWSDENASTIARVTSTIASGSRTIVVEDGTALLARDFILIRCGFREERARIASVLDDVITLDDPVADTYDIADRPRIERWNAFRVLIDIDNVDPLVSPSIPLEDGVLVRFGGRDFRRGDYWTLRTRYLARDQSSGVDPNTRIEDLGFVRPQGVTHHYAPLATITRSEHDGGRITSIKDVRRRVGNATVTDIGLPPLTGLTAVAADTPAVQHVGGTLLPPAGKESKYLVLLSGTLYVTGAIPGTGDPTLSIRVAFYNDKRTDPATHPDDGRIQDAERALPLARVQTSTEVPVHVTLVSSGTPFAFLPVEDFTPIAAEVFAQVKGTGFSVELSNLRLTAVELKKTT